MVFHPSDDSMGPSQSAPPFSPTEHGRPTSRLVPTLDSNLALDLVRTTEAAALGAALWVGRGDKIAADQAGRKSRALNVKNLITVGKFFYSVTFDSQYKASAR